jgi:hypothetical protein
MPFQWIDIQVTLFGGFTALAIVALLVVMLVRNGRRTHLVRRRLQCPVEGRPAVVDFVVHANDGAAYLDVVRCSLIAPGGPVECGKVCRRSAAGGR